MIYTYLTESFTLCYVWYMCVTSWYNGQGEVMGSTLSDNDVQIVYTHMPLVKNSIIWYWLKCGDAV